MNLYTVPETYIKVRYIASPSTVKERQLDAVLNLMLDGRWRTLEQIATRLEQPIQSVSARLRDLRKRRYGGWNVSRQMGDEPRVYLYKVED